MINQNEIIEQILKELQEIRRLLEEKDSLEKGAEKKTEEKIEEKTIDNKKKRAILLD